MTQPMNILDLLAAVIKREIPLQENTRRMVLEALIGRAWTVMNDDEMSNLESPDEKEPDDTDGLKNEHLSDAEQVEAISDAITAHFMEVNRWQAIVKSRCAQHSSHIKLNLHFDEIREGMRDVRTWIDEANKA